MALTQTQKDILAADIIVNRALIAEGDTAGASDFYNALAAPDFIIWNPFTMTRDVMDAITWANLTPADAADGTALWTNRALACQGKQFNIQTILVGRDIIDATRTNIRAGLQDALSSVPSGNAGTLVSGGWANVKIALTRKATRIEKLFAVGTGTAAVPAATGFIGPAYYFDFNGIV